LSAANRAARQEAKEDFCRWQERVLSLALEEDPRQLSELEVVRELAGEDPDEDQAVAVGRAIEELVHACLLRRCESLLILTRSAQHFARLGVSS
jgi:hypothetical protein